MAKKEKSAAGAPPGQAEALLEVPRILKVVYVDVASARVTNQWRGHSHRMPPIKMGEIRREVPDDDIDYTQLMWNGDDGFIQPPEPGSSGTTITAMDFRQQFSAEEWTRLCDMITGRF